MTSEPETILERRSWPAETSAQTEGSLQGGNIRTPFRTLNEDTVLMSGQREAGATTSSGSSPYRFAVSILAGRGLTAERR